MLAKFTLDCKPEPMFIHKLYNEIDQFVMTLGMSMVVNSIALINGRVQWRNQQLR
jgi:hypothetical protein